MLIKSQAIGNVNGTYSRFSRPATVEVGVGVFELSTETAVALGIRAAVGAFAG